MNGNDGFCDLCRPQQVPGHPTMLRGVFHATLCDMHYALESARLRPVPPTDFVRYTTCRLSPAALILLEHAGGCVKDLPTSFAEQNERLWHAFKLGRKFEQLGGDKAAMHVPDPEVVGVSECGG